MDKLKLKLQEYYQRCQQPDLRTKAGRDEAGGAVVLEMENDILLQFGLPTSKRFVQILHDFASHRQLSDQLLDYVSKKLRAAARKYLLAPVVSDTDLLQQAAEQKRSPYDLLPELGYPVNDFSIFLISEILYRRNIPAEDVLEELKKAQHGDVWDDLLALQHVVSYSTHELYNRLRMQDLRMMDDYLQSARRQEKEKATKRETPATEGYTPNYRMVSKILVDDIVFDEHDIPSIVGKLKAGSRFSKISISLELSALHMVLASAGELGGQISSLLKKKKQHPPVIDIRTEFGAELVLDNCYLEVYKPQQKRGQKWVEARDSFYYLHRILSKKEFEKKSKEEDTKQKIQECLDLIGGSYGYYQRMRKLGITDEEAKLRAGLQDELLFKLSTFLHKLKD